MQQLDRDDRTGVQKTSTRMWWDFKEWSANKFVNHSNCSNKKDNFQKFKKKKSVNETLSGLENPSYWQEPANTERQFDHATWTPRILNPKLPSMPLWNCILIFVGDVVMLIHWSDYGYGLCVVIFDSHSVRPLPLNPSNGLEMHPILPTPENQSRRKKTWAWGNTLDCQPALKPWSVLRKRERLQRKKHCWCRWAAS